MSIVSGSINFTAYQHDPLVLTLDSVSLIAWLALDNGHICIYYIVFESVSPVALLALGTRYMLYLFTLNSVSLVALLALDNGHICIFCIDIKLC